MNYGRNYQKDLLMVVVVGIYLFLLLPVLIVVLTSFTPKSFPAIPESELSFVWYINLLSDTKLLNALKVSLMVALSSSILSVILGTVTAIGFVRGEFPFKDKFAIILLLPMIISPVVTGIALVRYMNNINVPSGYPAIILAHMILTMPFVFLLVRSRLLTLDEELEKASRVLGATPVSTFTHVTLPIISPSILSGFFIAFVVSFGEFTATQFLISPEVSTVPVVIYTMLRTGLSPTINALSTILIIVMITGAALSRVLATE